MLKRFPIRQLALSVQSILLTLCTSGQSILAQEAPKPTTIIGRLSGYDGNRISRADIHLVRIGDARPFLSKEIERDGSYSVTIDSGSVVFVDFTGVYHQSVRVPLFLATQTTIHLDIRLQTYRYVDDFSNLKVVADSDDISAKYIRGMEKQADGTYVVEFKSAASKFAYQLAGITKTGNTVNGTLSESFEYDGGGDYKSVVSPRDGKVRIVFDPKLIIQDVTPPRVTFGDPSTITARYATLYDSMIARRNGHSAALREYKTSGRLLYTFSYNWSHELKVLRDQIVAERTVPLKQLLLFSYLDIGFGAYGADLNPNLVREALKEITPTSYLWSLEPELVCVALRNSSRPGEFSTYTREVIETHPDQRVRKLVKANCDPNRRVMAGKKVPPFSVESMDDSTVHFTDKSFIGTVYLIDFWATWCKPCIDEMDNLHRMYEKYKDKGFEILSLSLDEKPELPRSFRKERWKMPWLNAYLEGGVSSVVANEFEVVGIPKPILVNRDGIIVATEMDVRGARLKKSVKKVLGLK